MAQAKSDTAATPPHKRHWWAALLLHVFLLSGYLYVGRPGRFLLFFAPICLLWLFALSIINQTPWVFPLLEFLERFSLTPEAANRLSEIVLLLYLATLLDISCLAVSQKQFQRRWYNKWWAYLLPFFVLIVLPSAARVDHLGNIERNFNAEHAAFEKLRTLLAEEGKRRRGCFAISVDEQARCVSDKYFRGVACAARSNYKEHHFSTERFDEYVRLLEKTKAESITYCLPGPIPAKDADEVVLRYKRFGCRTHVILQEDGTVPVETATSRIKIIPLINGWYLQHYCR